nr:MAG TPA: hypothetical protein [Caudoviricetes sp.]
MPASRYCLLYFWHINQLLLLVIITNKLLLLV